MTRETKVGLLVGMGVILLIGIILSDILSIPLQSPRHMTDYAPSAQQTLKADGSGTDDQPRDVTPVTPPPGQIRQVGLPNEINKPQPAPGSDAGNAGMASNGLPPQQLFVPAPNPVPPPPQPAYYFVAQRGETFSNIAQKQYGDASMAPLIRNANPAAGLNPDGSLAIGAKLTIPARPTTFTPPQPKPIDNPLPPPAPAGPKTVKVQAGDTLSSLAAKYLGSSNRYPDLLKANKDQLDSADDTLRVGMMLKLPAPANVSGNAVGNPPANPAGNPTGPDLTRTEPSSSTPVANGTIYVVASGDTLYYIAATKLGDGKYWKQIYDANRATIKDARNLSVGMKLVLPQVHG